MEEVTSWFDEDGKYTDEEINDFDPLDDEDY